MLLSWPLSVSMSLTLPTHARAQAQGPALPQPHAHVQAQAPAQIQAPPPDPAHPARTNPAGIDWVRVADFQIARTETTVGQFRRYVMASGVTTQAERQGGGSVFEAGWVRKPGWTWSSPFGAGHRPAEDEPVAHVTYDEAQGFCRWAGGQLPDDAQWRLAAYTETRSEPAPPFQRGRTYVFPTGERPQGAQCLEDCGAEARAKAVRHGARLSRGYGHARAGQTVVGVNGLYDMGANLWEWVDEPKGLSGNAERLTRGGSWWYGAAQMRADHLQSKPGNTAVVYIGFRCVRP